MKNIYMVIVTILLVFIVFKDDISDYVKNININGLSNGSTQEEVQVKKDSIILIFNKVESLVFGANPNPEPDKPRPGGKCLNCNGTGTVTHGDGHRTPCVPCDGKGVIKSLSNDILSSISKSLKEINDKQIEDRYDEIFGTKDMVCVGESCEL
jgi:DnaJ-class molecular chaperone